MKNVEKNARKKRKWSLLWLNRRKNEVSNQDYEQSFVYKRQLIKMMDLEPTALLVLEKKESELYISGRNDALKKMIQETIEAKGLIGKKIFKIIPDLKAHENHIFSVLGGAKEAKTSFWLTIGNKHFFIKMIVRPWIDGKQNTVIVALIDSTKQENAIRENERFKQEREAIILQKDGVISIISHDLLNSFNGTIGFINLLANNNDLPKEKIKRIVSNLEKAANNQLQIVNEVLEWYRLSSNYVDYTATSLKLKGVVEIAIVNNGLAAERKDIKLSVEVDDEISVVADKHILVSILNNLLFNAIKFSYQSSKITLAASIMSKENTVRISVKDTGVGMTPETLKSIFDVIKQKTRSGTDGEIGTGLGLINCKRFVESYGGEIWAESKEGEGTTFYFTIPLAREKK